MNRQQLADLRDRLRTRPLPSVKAQCRSVEQMMEKAFEMALPEAGYYEDFDEFFEQSRAYFRAIAFSYTDSGIPESAYDNWPDRLEARARILWEDHA